MDLAKVALMVRKELSLALAFVMNGKGAGWERIAEDEAQKRDGGSMVVRMAFVRVEVRVGRGHVLKRDQ